MSLRSILTIALAACGGLALGAGILLVLLTTHMYGAAADLHAGADRIRVGQEMQTDLLLHDRARDSLHRAAVEADLRGKVTHLLHDPHRIELSIVEEVARTVAAYLDSPDPVGEGQPDDARARSREPLLDDAFSALNELVRAEVTQAREDEARAARLDGIANVLGITTAVLLLAGVTLVLLWLRWSAFQPLFAIGEAMQRFAGGDTETRAVETGADELRDMARRFNDMAAQLGAQQQRQVAFLAGVAHDLRNPLSALRLSLERVSPNRPLPTEERLRSILGVLGRQVERLDRMVGDFLDASQIQAGRLELRLESRDVRAIVHESVELFRPSSNAHHLESCTPNEPVVADCDGARLEQVLNNLISNAIKYSPNGGVVRVELARQEDEVAISVRDEGIGLSPESRERLFEPFRRVGLSKESIPGVGLGLFVARRIVEAHGGRIEVESRLGAGATFRVRLPCAATNTPQLFSLDAARERFR